MQNRKSQLIQLLKEKEVILIKKEDGEVEIGEEFTIGRLLELIQAWEELLKKSSRTPRE